MDMMIEAWGLPVVHNSVGASAQREEAVYGFPRFPCSHSRGKGAEIFCAIVPFHAANDFHSGERFSFGDAEHNILLVVPQADIVMRPMLFYET